MELTKMTPAEAIGMCRDEANAVAAAKGHMEKYPALWPKVKAEIASWNAAADAIATLQAENEALAGKVVEMREALTHTGATMSRRGMELCDAALAAPETEAEARVKEWREDSEALAWANEHIDSIEKGPCGEFHWRLWRGNEFRGVAGVGLETLAKSLRSVKEDW